MRASIIVVPHFGHGGRMMALDEAWVVDDGMVLSFFRREHNRTLSGRPPFTACHVATETHPDALVKHVRESIAL